MKVLIDTCVAIDFLQKREPFADDALRIFRAAASELFAGYITAKSATDIYYISHRCTHSDVESRKNLRALLTIVGMLDSAAKGLCQVSCSRLRPRRISGIPHVLRRGTFRIVSHHKEWKPRSHFLRLRFPV